MVADAAESCLRPRTMAFGRLERTTGPQPMSDINMTPLIDVMLVLLVIFMITAPLMTSSLKLDLPEDRRRPAERHAAVPSRSRSTRPASSTIGEEPLDCRERFAARVAAAAKKNPATEVQLRADRSVAYGRVAELIGMVQKAGLSRIGFIAEPGAASTQ
jgi:biopolymer transport protein ExbD/biopolymer transport protein TolR